MSKNINENVRKFNGDKETKEDLKAYIISFFEESILKRAYENKDVRSLSQAVQEIKKAFDQLDIDYGVPEDTTKPTNQAR